MVAKRTGVIKPGYHREHPVTPQPPPAPPSPESVAHSLGCLEVWGGNEAFEGEVTVPGLDVWVWCRPYKGDVHGGDLHYISMCRCHSISRFTIADVCGHGEVVNSLAHRLRSLMRKHINTPDQTRLVRSLNREFQRLKEQNRFATALLATYYPPTDQLIICNAGHPHPLWYDSASQTWCVLESDTPQRLKVATNLPLGVIEQTDYTQFSVRLGVGDIVLMYTDSLIESLSPTGRMLGLHGLMDMAREVGVDAPQAIGGRLIEKLTAFRGGKACEDDQTLLVLRHNASDPPKLSLAEKLRVMTKMLRLVGD